MKRLFLAGMALVAVAATATAADLPPAPYYKGPAFMPPAYSWTGLYIGVNGGGGFGRSTWDTTGGFDTSGGLVGGTLGYNFQYGQAVLGVEGDIDWSGIGGSTSTGCPAGCSTGDSWLSTVRGRLGWATGRLLPYVTGGAAFGNINATTAGLTTTTTNAGWTVGAGLEFAIAGNWSAKAEYLYVNLGSFNCGLNCGAATDNVSFSTNLIRGGINYRF
jgi:outer membrane immunogenic protein